MREDSYEFPDLMLFSERGVPIIDAKRENRTTELGRGPRVNVVKPVH